ncbi:MAG: hypothetical protein RLZZ590_601 [Actinomycetota bacterium]
MNRRLTFLIAAFEALVIAGIGVGITLAPLTVIWLFENDPSIDWFVAFRAASDIWLMAHGTRLVVAEGVIMGVEAPSFVISVVPLGLTFLIGFLALRLGRRLTAANELWPGWLSATAVYGAISLFLSTAAHNAAIYPVNWQGTFLPPIFFAIVLIVGSLTGKRQLFGEASNLPEAAERIWFKNWVADRVDNLHWGIRALAMPALRAGTGIVAMLLAISAVMIAVLLAVNWITVTRFYEGLQVSVLGGIMVTAGQLAVLPNLVIFGAAWLTGVGFQFGAGSIISPIATNIGPMPIFPIVGAIPAGQVSFGLIAVAVPLLGAFAATLLIKRHADEVRFEFASAWNAAISLGLAIGFVAAVEMGILAAAASGGFGPGRLQTVGINPLLLMGVVFVETASVSILAAFFSARPDKPDHPLLLERSR